MLQLVCRGCLRETTNKRRGQLCGELLREADLSQCEVDGEGGGDEPNGDRGRRAEHCHS